MEIGRRGTSVFQDSTNVPWALCDCRWVCCELRVTEIGQLSGVQTVCWGLGKFRGCTQIQFDVRELWENPADTFEQWQANEQGGNHSGAFVAFESRW